MTKPRLTSTLIISSVIAIAVVAVLVVPALYKQPQTISDKELSQLTSEDNQTASTNNQNTSPKTVDHTQQSDTQLPAASSTLANNAPKQAAIKASVKKENVYYPMLTANDPGYASNWAIQKMNAPTAWDTTTGNGSTIVAVIDSGFSLNHDDLSDRWHENTGETGTTSFGDSCWTGSSADKQTNNCDDDNNGYVDDWRGWNFVLGDNDPSAGRDNPNGDAVSHGTETAGLTGARGNNSTGITTVNWNTQLMPLQVLSDDGPGYTSDVAAALYYAVDNGADVVNMSLGGIDSDSYVRDAVQYAYDNDVVVVAAAGNCGTGNEEGCTTVSPGFVTYPGRDPHVISVGATNSSDTRASFSSYGTALDVVAPGSGAINTPTWTPGDATSLYATTIYGTSYASPLVASLASLIKSIRPDSSVDDVTALILGTATKTSAMNGQFYTNEYGHGLANAAAAIAVAASLNSTEENPILHQAGSRYSEHSYRGLSSLDTGCITQTAESYCTIWTQQDGTGYDRYLPYTLTSLNSDTDWTWNTSVLGSSYWKIKAAQGDMYSYSYYIGPK